MPLTMENESSQTRATGATIEVRQATPDDQAAIYAFIQTAYAGRSEYKIPARWAWAYVNNPFKKTDCPADLDRG